MMLDERRRIALHRHAAETWGEEAADTLLELGAPAGHQVATRSDLDDLEQRLDHRFELIDHRLEALEHRLTATFERGISAAVTTQTRTLVFSQLGSLVVITALAFGLR